MNTAALTILGIDPGIKGAGVFVTITPRPNKPLGLTLEIPADSDPHSDDAPDWFWPGYLDVDRWRSVMRARDNCTLWTPRHIVLEGQNPRGSDGKHNTHMLQSLQRNVGRWESLFMAIWPGTPVISPQWASVGKALSQYLQVVEMAQRARPGRKEWAERVRKSAARTNEGSDLKMAGYRLAATLDQHERERFLNRNDTFISGRTDALALAVGAYMSGLCSNPTSNA